MSRAELLMSTMEEAYARLRARIGGLTDEEFFWQPRPQSWTIYEDTPGHWTYHYAIPDPDPAPVTTIGWQLVHLWTCKVMYHEWAFGPARLTFSDLEIPHDALTSKELLDQAHKLLEHDLQSESESGLDQPRKTNWGDTWPAWRIFTAMTDHDAFHGGTIGYLRDLFYWSHHGSESV